MVPFMHAIVMLIDGLCKHLTFSGEMAQTQAGDVYICLGMVITCAYVHDIEQLHIYASPQSVMEALHPSIIAQHSKRELVSVSTAL